MADSSIFGSTQQTSDAHNPHTASSSTPADVSNRNTEPDLRDKVREGAETKLFSGKDQPSAAAGKGDAVKHAASGVGELVGGERSEQGNRDLNRE